jgi:hypothetical protein
LLGNYAARRSITPSVHPESCDFIATEGTIRCCKATFVWDLLAVQCIIFNIVLCVKLLETSMEKFLSLQILHAAASTLVLLSHVRGLIGRQIGLVVLRASHWRWPPWLGCMLWSVVRSAAGSAPGGDGSDVILMRRCWGPSSFEGKINSPSEAFCHTRLIYC